MKYSPADDIITIKTEAQENICRVSVSDNGIGMSTKEVEELFSKSKIDSKEGTRGEKGAGLGFQLCRDFVAQNKGKLEIDTAPGKGTVMIFTLPLTQM